MRRARPLRGLPPTDPEYPRGYGVRADTESLNAQFELAFYNQQLLAWGLPNQIVIVLLPALDQNAWARQTWQRAIEGQQSPPAVAAYLPAIPTSTAPDSVMPTSPLRATRSLPDTSSAAEPAPGSTL